MTQSRFVNISTYCIAEYMFEPLSSTNFLSEDFILLENETLDINQIINTDAALNTTRNVKDLSVVPIGNNKFAYLDSEKIPDYLSYDTNIVQTNVNGYSIPYDKVRFHFISGFTPTQFEGLILSIRHLQNNAKTNVFANIILTRETFDDLITFNPKPLFLANSTYDRYVDIKIPSIKNINEDYKTALNQANTFAAKITPSPSGGYSGFVYNNQITVNLSECRRRSVINTNVGTTYDIFEVSDSFDASLSQSNEFDSVGAYVGESTNGDFIEYYLTYEGGFPEDLIAILNRRNPSNDWIVIHQLSIFEQLGSSFVNTGRQVIFQEDKFDEPLVIRPVLRNAGQAVSMAIDLVCRLTNRLNGEQIIREASFTLLSPKKYGRNLTVIPLTDEPQSQKIYNKIIKANFEASNLFIEPSFAPGFGVTPTQEEAPAQKSVEYIPIFFSNNNISASNSNGLLQTSDTADEVIFGPGQLRFIVSPFDNAIKIKLYNVINEVAIPLDLNLNNSRFQLVFDLDTGKVPISNANSATEENLSTGEIMFKISKADSQKIVESSNRSVYITSIAQNGTENLMYSGEWRLSSEQSEIDDLVKSIRGEVTKRISDAERIIELEEEVEELRKQILKSLVKGARDAIRGSIKPKAVAPTVNRVFTNNPTVIKTNAFNSTPLLNPQPAPTPPRPRFPGGLLKKS
jgi:hypothetical protein